MNKFRLNNHPYFEPILRCLFLIGVVTVHLYLAQFSWQAAIVSLGLCICYHFWQKAVFAKKMHLLNVNVKKMLDESDRLNDNRKELLRNLDHARNLVHVLCHDLGNTLTVILGAASRGRRKKYKDEQKLDELWNRIHKAATVQKDMIAQVRTIERIKSGKLNIATSKVDLHEMIEKAEFMFEDKLKEKKITINKIYDHSGEYFVIAEPISLSNNVINNIVSNAIKFSNPESTIDFIIKKTQDYIEFSIKDYGIGIPLGLQDDLFALDKPTSRTGTKGERGNGFGMPLVSSFMDYFEGSVYVKSKDIETHPNEHGTEVILRFNSNFNLK